MIELLVVSVIWSFSFPLIGMYLKGLDGSFVAFARMALAFLVFLPFLRPRRIPPDLALRLVGIGALQLGVMYVAYLNSYRFLKFHEVALFTVLTPLWITLIDGAISRRLTVRFHLAAGIAIAGAVVLKWQGKDLTGDFIGILLVQVSNAAFGVGQVLYRRTMAGAKDIPHRRAMGWMYIGAVWVTLAATAATTDLPTLSVTPAQAGVIVYLGIVAAGLGFFLWNRGATKVSAGVLAVMNNGYLPIVIVVGLVVFGKDADPVRLAIGTVLIVAALLVNGRSLSADSWRGRQ
ncbi:MAG: EamA family transporter [Planctomycetota bacterium]